MLKVAPVRSKKHRMFVASLPCAVSGLEGQSQAAHIRTGCGGGMGYKSGDDWTIPLSWMEHLRQHGTSEEKYWGKNLEPAKRLAQDLYAVSGDYEAGYKLVSDFRNKYFPWRVQ